MVNVDEVGADESHTAFPTSDVGRAGEAGLQVNDSDADGADGPDDESPPRLEKKRAKKTITTVEVALQARPDYTHFFSTPVQLIQAKTAYAMMNVDE